MKINSPGLKIITDSEGYSNTAYLCPSAVWTIGWGTTVYPDGQSVKSGDTTTPRQAEDYLLHDLTDASCAVCKLVKVQLNENQYSALISFVYNVGIGNFQNSTLLKRLNNGEDPCSVVKQELPKWNKAKGKILKGLVTRRKLEVELFCQEVK